MRDVLSERGQRVVFNSQVSTWTDVTAGITHSIIGPSLFITYINDLCEGLSTSAKLFADNTPFSIILESQASANDNTKDLETIHNWAFQ